LPWAGHVAGATASRRSAPNTGTHYPITDALGSVIALTDAAGTKTDTYSYDPYGADTGSTGSTENPFRFTGQHRDPTGLYKIGLRYYTPELGRWTQPDPGPRQSRTDG
jgi:RHS repeat-associated protein